MIIKFSRHAKRRASLYKIPENIVQKMLNESQFSEGEHEIIKRINGFKYPIKIVISVEAGNITVITNYPLKKGMNDESSL